MKNSGILAWWINNPVAANLAMVALIVAGIVSYLYDIEKEPFPTVQLPIMDVSLRWPGAGPREIEEQIIVRFEEAVKQVEGIKKVVSSAREGRAHITITGKERVDRRKFADAIRSKINAVNGLPADADQVIVTERSNREKMIRLALHGEVDEKMLNRLARQIRTEIAALSLISSVQLSGSRLEEVTIEIEEAALQRYNLNFNEVATAIKNSSINLSTGVVRGPGGVIQMGVRNRADEQQEFENILIRQAANGASLYLRDVASVVDGLKDSPHYSAFGGERTVLIDVMNSDHMNIPRMSANVSRYVNKKQQQLPPGLTLTIWSDWNDAYKSRLTTIFNSATSGLLLVFILLLLFLQPRVALWVTAGIATSFAATFALLPMSDVSLNMLSLFAFMMVIGIVVDDAIVVGESIHLASEQGHSGDQAALTGVRQVAKPVVFGVLTTMVIFAPMAFLPGSTAEFTRAISIVVVVALAFSLLESLYILPSHLRHLSTSRGEQSSRSRWNVLQQRIAASMDFIARQLYRPLLSALLGHKLSVVIAFVGLLLVSLSLLNNNYVRQSFMPQIESDEIRLVVTMPELTTPARTRQVLAQINEGQQQLLRFAANHPHSSTKSDSDDSDGVETNHKLEKNLVEHYYNQIRATRIVSIVKLVPAEQRIIDMTTAADKLRKLIGEIPDAEDIEFRSTLNASAPKLGYTLRSHDIVALKEAVNELKNHLARYEGVHLVRDNLDKGSQEMVFSLKPGVETLGISLRDISKQIKQAYFGLEVQRLPKDGGDSRVKVMYSKTERQSIDTLQQLRIRTRDGRAIPLMALVDINLQPGIQRIYRRDGANVGHIRAEYAGDDQYSLLREIKEDFLPDWKKRHPQVSFGHGARGEDENEFINTVIRYEGLALLVAYMLVAISFRCYFQPLLILSAIPFGFAGAILGHLLHDISYSMFSILGILAASGVVVNDNLVLVDAINRFRAQGKSAYEAVTQATQLRFRPIVLTSMTTFIGLLPMMSANSVQAKFLVPMVVSLAYGVVFATITTLVLVPCLYLLGSHTRRRLKINQTQPSH